MPQLATALGPLLLAAARGSLPNVWGSRVPALGGASVGIVLASAGYPDAPAGPERIEGLDEAADGGAIVFHAATRATNDGEGLGDGRRPRPDGRRAGRGPGGGQRGGREGSRRDQLARHAAASRHRLVGRIRRRYGCARGSRVVIRRYTLPEMGAVWTDRARFEQMLRVEIAVARAQSKRGLVPADSLAAIEEHATVDVDRIAEIEATTDHDVIAFVSQVAESVGPDGRYLHLGLTSSDVVDTGLALQLRAAGELLLKDCDRLLVALIARARIEAETVMMGRTHSVHAEPITLGHKLAGWAFELDRGRRRLAEAVDEAGTGKISGPVGTYSHLGPDIEADVLAELDLHVDPASTQIVQRDRHAALLTSIAIVGGSLERFATEIRNLQHTEIGELQEPFKAGQKGSSAMPHKRNPILSERIAGLARLLRGYAGAALEDQPLWHERDISHSSAERVILPDATILLDYMLVRMTGLIEGLVVRGERMRENIERGLGLHASSRVLVALVERGGLSREDAYAIVQRAALKAADERRPLRDLLAIDATVAAKLTPHRPRRLLRRRRRSSATSPPSSPDSTAWRQKSMSPVSSTAGSFVRSGKVRDLYAIGEDRLLLVASDRLSRVRRRPADRDPRQGPGADGPVEVLVLQDGVDRAEPPPRGRAGGPPRRDGLGPGRLPRAARPDDALPPGRRPPDRGHRPGLHRGLRLEGLPPDGRRLRDRAPGGPQARASACPSRCSRPRRRPRWATTRTSTLPRRRGSSARTWRCGSATSRSSCTSSGRRSRSRPGSSSPTRSSSSGSTARPASCC